MSLIYITTNLINNHKYIGKQVDDNKINYLGSGVYLKNAIKLYGKENFKKEIIVQGNFNKLLLGELEKHYIQLYAAVIKDDYYNISPGGDGGKVKVGFKWSKEQKDNFKKVVAIRNANPKYIAKLGKSKKGKELSSEHKAKLSKAHSNQKNLNLAKAVIQYDTNNQFIQDHISIAEAARQLNKTSGQSVEISKVCKGQKEIAFGYKWKYKTQ